MNADIIEEITRIYGYDNFEINTTRSPLYPVRMTEVKTDEEKIKDLLVKKFSLHEVHSYVWAYNDELKALGIAIEDNVRLANATNPNIEILRRSIIPTQLCQVKANTSFAPEFGIFEIGRIVDGLDENNLCIEHKKLTITLYSKTTSMKELYFRLRDILASVALDVKHSVLTFHTAEPTQDYIHPVNFNQVLLDGKELGIIGMVHPVVGKNIDKKANIVFAEIDVDDFASCADKSIVYSEPSKYPTMEYDLSLDMPEGTFYGSLTDCWEQEGGEILKSVRIVDTYDTDTVHRITVRFEFSSNERTLSSAEVQEIVDRILQNLSSRNVTIQQGGSIK